MTWNGNLMRTLVMFNSRHFYYQFICRHIHRNVCNNIVDERVRMISGLLLVEEIIIFYYIDNVITITVRYTVEPLYSGHPWDKYKCPD